MTAASRWEVVHDGPRAFHARLVAPNGEILVWSESYTTRRRAQDVIDLVLLYAKVAAGRVRQVEER